MFYNLIVNALKYNDRSQPIIEIGQQDSENEKIIFVKDNGIGIEPEHHDLIFKIFHRLHDKNKYDGGTGIGLPIVQKIIEEHNGRTWVESETGKGATFFFSIPKRKIAIA